MSKTRPIVVVDVDLTVCNPIPHWIAWLEKHTAYKPSYIPFERGGVDYNITKYWSDFLDDDFDGLGFWREETVYDNIQPYDEAVHALEALHSYGARIRFASHIKGNHHKSKYNFVKRNFPFMEGFAATKEKWMLEFDYIIDDRVAHLNKIKYPQEGFLVPTPYTQDAYPARGVHIVEGWTEIIDKIVNQTRTYY